MQDVPLGILIGILVFLLIASAFFAGTETALMSINRYRMRHRARAGHRGAQLAERLLRQPDRLIGLILLGNNVANIVASSLVTIIALRAGGEATLAIAQGLLVLIILVFIDLMPKTLGALRPEQVSYPAAYIYAPLLKLLYPFVWVVNTIANGLLSLMGVRIDEASGQPLSRSELRTVVVDAGAIIPKRHQRMLLNILDLEEATVEDIMVPRSEITGIDINDDWDDIVAQLTQSQHTKLPLFVDSIDDIIGMIHLRQVLRPLGRGELTPESLKALARKPYFVPEGTSLHRQLINFQNVRRRIGLVVDEYGDIQGMVTIEDILEEIVGEFTTDPAASHKDIFPEPDGSYLVNAGIAIRTLNRALKWQLPTDGPKTLNGLIVEYLEDIPEPRTSVRIGAYGIEIVQTGDNAVKTVRIRPVGRAPGAS
ncbi:MAG TPA: HlyC/CorC family transporter [Gammaproteobacteria bacterium]|nr:HlyC/CorC family transporter [Gammaproteobacteria bacterium]HET7588546.1 HlyC/CorC family transporter [Gammaproteobacteria bacterium]